MHITLRMTIVVAVLATTTLQPRHLWASDHLDSPYIDEHPQADIGDTWAFPTKNGVVFAASFNPLSDPLLIDQMKLDQDVLYEFKFDMDSDGVADLAYKISVSGLGQKQKLTVRRAEGVDAISNRAAGDVVLEGVSSTRGKVEIARGKGFRLFCGPRQDPFFFNFKGVQSPVALALQYALGADGLPSDGSWQNTFGPTNVTMLMLEVEEMRGRKFGMWGTTSLDGKQIDRCGRASVTAVFLPNTPTGRNPADYPYGGENKQKYNTTRPVDDRANYGAMFRHTLDVLEADENLADFYLPDILQYDPHLPDEYPNGRNLYDDSVFWTIKHVNPFQFTLPEKNPQNLLPEFPFAAPPVAPPAEPPNEYMVKIVSDLYEGMQRGNFSGIPSQCSPTVEWSCFGPSGAPYSGTFAGKEGIDDHFRQLQAIYDIKSVTVDRYVTEGSFVTAIVRQTGIEKATKEPVEFNCVHCWEITNSRISRVREYLSIGQPNDKD
ncbi:MAG: DUF4331 family protein [Planctomycetaceae bacterium]